MALPKYTIPVVLTLGIVFAIYYVTNYEEPKVQIKSASTNDKLDLAETRRVVIDERRPTNPAYVSYVVNPSFSLEAAALYWQATENGLTYVTTFDIIGNTSPNPYVKGEEHQPHFKWDWGFRLGATYDLPYDGWDLYTDWTRYHTTNHRKESVSGTDAGFFTPDDELLDLFKELIIGVDGSTAKAEWKLNMDLIDLEVGRASYFGKFLELRFHAGLRNGWINQRMKTEYDTVDILKTSNGKQTIIPGDSKKIFKNNFWGLGPRIGFDSQWNVGGGCSFFGDAALSGLVGHFSLSTYEHNVALTQPGTASFKIRSSPSSTSLVVDLDVGFRWERKYTGSKYAVMFDAAYEYHLFTNQNQFMYQFKQNGNLSTQGVTLKMRVGF